MNFITQAQLTEWLDSLARQQTLSAPREVSGVMLYRPVESSQEIAWGFSRPVMSVKEAFFPPTERLLTIEKIDGGIQLTETLPEDQQVIFGVRPCDARGVKILDALFLDTGAVDPYYARRRANTTLIGLACKEMGPTCFCTSVGGAPDEASDMDVMLYEVEGGYAIEAVTEKGKALLQTIDHGGQTIEKPIVNRQSSIVNPNSISWPSHFDDEYWARMSERCLSCRACAYVCPTCRCFIVRDEILPFEAATGKPGNGQFERIRCWDSCEGENYRRTAGGHRPRAEKSERLRNRFFCKFYYYSEQYGLGQTSACTGCGRCVDVCPVNVDITEVLTDLGRSA
ncbi:MAG: 4Fe-4S dicluster domain-containing protein [Anaerolineales bacterium]|nr:4Fe-4S dicluster domain-containing protein [Anaerolineales bacterium]